MPRLFNWLALALPDLFTHRLPSTLSVGGPRIPAVLVMLFFFGITAGCGGDEKPAELSDAAQTSEDSAEEDSTEPVAEEGEDPAEGDEGENAENPDSKDGSEEPKGTGDNEPEPKPEPEVPQRPEEVSKWGPADYASAKKDGDRKLFDAVNYLAEKYEGNEKVAQTLVQLLVNEPPPKLENGALDERARPIEVSRGVAEATITALGRSKTQTALEALILLLQGRMDMPLERERAVGASLAALGENCSGFPPFEDLMFTAVTHPEKIHEKSQLQDFKPIRIQYQAMLEVEKHPNRSIRLRLAKHLEDPQVPQETARVIEDSLAKPTFDNVLAQLLLFQNPRSDKRTLGRIEYILSNNSGRAVELILGIPEKLETPPPPGTLSRPSVKQGEPVDDHREQYLEFARQFWTPRMLDFLNNKVKENGLGTSSVALRLLGTAPRAESRFLMSELLSFYAHKGPRDFQSADLLGKETSDPGIIVLFKQVYQRQSIRAGSVISKPDEKRPPVDEASREAWQNSVQAAVQQWFARCYSAARMADPPMKSETAEDEMKIHLHPDANIVAQFHVDWPKDVQSELPNFEIAPLKLHYYRIEEDGDVERLVARYQRYAGKGSKGKTYPIRGGKWLDGFNNGSEPNSRLSIDIQITGETRNEDAGVDSSKSVPLVIEILTIEIPIPSPPEDEKVTRSS